MLEVKNSDIIIVVECSFLSRENGSHSRIDDQLRYFLEKYRHVTVYSFYEHYEYPWTDDQIALFNVEFPDASLVLDHRSKTALLATRLRNALLAFFPAKAGAIARWQIGAGAAWRRLKQNSPAGVFIFNFIDTVTQVNGIADATLIVESHDVKSFKAAKVEERHPSSLRIIGKFRSETALLSLADAVVAISPPEAILFRTIAPGPEVFYVPSYKQATCDLTDQPQANHDLLFVGADNNFNVDGLAGFVDANHPWLAARRVAVAGNVCRNPQIVELAARYDWLELLGFVKDLAPVYRRAKAVISPVDGTGLKIKVVEALANAKPVFASQHSRDGLPAGGEGAVFALDADEIAAVLDSPPRLAAAERAAFDYYQKFADAGDLAILDTFVRAALSV